MSWVKVSDQAVTHPIVLAAELPDDPRAVNEVLGFVVRCAALAALHDTSRLVTVSMARVICADDATADRLLRAALQAGYLDYVEAVDAWRIVNDGPLS